MKKLNLLSILAFIVFLLFNPITGNAKIWRVNNGSNYNVTSLWGSNLCGSPADPIFKQINQAVAWN